MSRQRWRKSFKSFIHPTKDEHLRGSKTEIDGNVQKILDFIKEEDGGEDRKEALTDLVGDFYKQYESLYARYDQLTGELRSKFRGKSGRKSESSSSDSSDSDDSPMESGIGNGEVEINVEENSSVSEREEWERKLAAAVDEKEALHQEFQTALKSKNDDVSLLREENAQLQLRNSEMEQVLVGRENEFSDLQKRFGDRESELSEQILTLTAEVNSLREQKSEADRIAEKQREEISEFLVHIENLKGKLSQVENQSIELGNLIVEKERERQEQRDELLKLSEEHKQLEIRFRECHENLMSTEKKLDEISDQFRESMGAKIQDIDQLEETIEDLKSELEIKDDEVSTLVENMRATEVKQRLSSQKLRITEQVLSEKEELHQKRVEKLLEENKLLEQRIASLVGIVSIYKKAQVNLVAEISEKINKTMNAIDTFGVKFEEDYGHLESRVYEIRNELKVVVSWITGNNAEKDEMKKEIISLVQQLKDVKEQELVLREKVEELETVLQKNEDERKSLTEKVKELKIMIEEKDEKVGELERKMNEKESGMLSLSEEKREAIRQLCIWSDFHHDRYEDLKGMILKKRGGTRQIAA